MGLERMAKHGSDVLPPTSLPAADHPACDLALSPVHPELPGPGTRRSYWPSAAWRIPMKRCRAYGHGPFLDSGRNLAVDIDRPVGNLLIPHLPHPGGDIDPYLGPSCRGGGLCGAAMRSAFEDTENAVRSETAAPGTNVAAARSGL